MFSLLTDIVEGLLDLLSILADVVTFRRQRRARGHRDRDVVEDAGAVARFDFITGTMIALASVAVMLILKLLLDVSTAWSLAAGLAVGAIWGAWRYRQLLDER